MIEVARGIIIRRRKDQEADTVATILTEEGKLLRLRFHGILQSKNRSTLLTEPGTYVDMRVHSRVDSQTASVKEGTIIERFESWKTGYSSLALLSCLLEFAEGVSPSIHEESFGLLLEALREGETSALVYSELGACLFLNGFRLRAMQLAGFIGEIGSCSSCEAPLEDFAFWSIPEMSFQCDRCTREASAEHARLSRTIAQLLAGPFSKMIADNNFEKESGSDLEHLKRLEHLLSICIRHAMPFASPAVDAFTAGPMRIQ